MTMNRSIAFALSFLLIGCAATPPVPTPVDGPYQGPPITVASDGRKHVAVVEAPTPGWEVTLSLIEPAYHHQAAFLTLRKPHPGVIYPQVVVRQKVATGVPVDTPIRIYARVIEHDARATLDGEFFLAARGGPGASPSDADLP
jgi:hypothetical protein